ncbi:MAG: HD domain-containing protein [bacterium]
MTNLVFREIAKKAQKCVRYLAKQNGWFWFYNMHQKAVIKSAKDLLKLYPKADQKIVLISCWLHDIAHYYAKDDKEILTVKKNHHIDGARIAEEILSKHEIDKIEINKIINCVLRHRNLEAYRPRTLEEKVVVVADALSHFRSIFYLTYFKFHPKHSLEEMVKVDLEKIERDWRDVQLLPKAKKLAEDQYRVLKKMLEEFDVNKRS